VGLADRSQRAWPILRRLEHHALRHCPELCQPAAGRTGEWPSESPNDTIGRYWILLDELGPAEQRAAEIGRSVGHGLASGHSTTLWATATLYFAAVQTEGAEGAELASSLSDLEDAGDLV
jgi:hypothetical protein